MRVPMKVDYGVRALVELALHYGQGQLQTSEIAAKQSIPEAYLEQLMTTLNKMGFVRSRRGPQGGHSLAMVPSEINLSMVMNSLDGSFSPLECITYPNDCVFADSCAQQEIWRSVDEAIQEVLRSTTLADLAQRQKVLAGHSAAR
ncbi:MAG: Rrf2 family transcriptional regulator [SAR202 cluster bacterium]|nr:Rrf2 family transcriptional regulator [SAR202 cluster bacterium]